MEKESESEIDKRSNKTRTLFIGLKARVCRLRQQAEKELLLSAEKLDRDRFSMQQQLASTPIGSVPESYPDWSAQRCNQLLP
jgi:hypothetical protein